MWKCGVQSVDYRTMVREEIIERLIENLRYWRICNAVRRFADWRDGKRICNAVR